MSNLREIQRRVASLVMQPLTREDRMRQRTAGGRLASREAESLIKPNNRLSSFERLEIYNRQYWFRLLASFAEDYPGLRTILGSRVFENMARAYLTECPSQSFTLRNLGSRLVTWLSVNPQWGAPRNELALDMARLEWAHIEAFDGLREPALTAGEIQHAGLDLCLSLQPYVRLLELTYPVDDLLIEAHGYNHGSDTSSNAALERHPRPHRRQA